ncbi:hypothetical protein HDV02_005672, partial [Globomyces sp. JEL0801]
MLYHSNWLTQRKNTTKQICVTKSSALEVFGTNVSGGIYEIQLLVDFPDLTVSNITVTSSKFSLHVSSGIS